MAHSELHSEEHLPYLSIATRQGQGHSPQPSLARPTLLAARSRSHLDRVHNLQTDIDIPSPAGGPSSASPSTWSIASSDTGPSSANSSVIESRHRYERLPNGSHRHHLSAPKRQQFLFNQVRRLRELLDGKREREDPTVPHHLRPEVFEHPLSLLNERYQDMDTENNQQQHGGPSLRRRNTVKMDFVHKYGELKQVVGKGAFGTVRLSIKRNPDSGEESVYAIK
ncbi:serine/threonine-protein kinase HAL4/sat4, partial [Podila verticillata]